jgi:hypothetical protein
MDAEPESLEKEALHRKQGAVEKPDYALRQDVPSLPAAAGNLEVQRLAGPRVQMKQAEARRRPRMSGRPTSRRSRRFHRPTLGRRFRKHCSQPAPSRRMSSARSWWRRSPHLRRRQQVRLLRLLRRLPAPHQPQSPPRASSWRTMCRIRHPRRCERAISCRSCGERPWAPHKVRWKERLGPPWRGQVSTSGCDPMRDRARHNSKKPSRPVCRARHKRRLRAGIFRRSLRRYGAQWRIGHGLEPRRRERLRCRMCRRRMACLGARLTQLPG